MRKRSFFLIFLALLTLLSLGACADGKDGKNGRNGMQGTATPIATQPGDNVFLDWQDTGFLGAQKTAKISVITDTPERGDVYGGGTYVPGAVVLLYAVPRTGYRFVHWMDYHGGILSADPVLAVFAKGESNRTYTARFVPDKSTAQVRVHLRADDTLPDTAKLCGEGTYRYGEETACGRTADVWPGDTVTVRASAATAPVMEESDLRHATLSVARAVFEGWYNSAGELLSTDPEYTFVAPGESIGLICRFQKRVVIHYSGGAWLPRFLTADGGVTEHPLAGRGTEVPAGAVASFAPGERVLVYGDSGAPGEGTGALSGRYLWQVSYDGEHWEDYAYGREFWLTLPEDGQDITLRLIYE